MLPLSVDQLVHFCVLAVQKGLVGREDVLTAMRASAANRIRPLQQVLLEDVKTRIEDVDAVGEELQRLIQNNAHGPGTTLTPLPMQDSLFMELMEICDQPQDASARVPEENKRQAVV